ncbi:MAG: amino acid ABC transporter substrate-binding protein [Chloroflexia bacterium]|nr:amino acid ABC transporter substrate-binding protein [Chloroflexia bacterium]
MSYSKKIGLCLIISLLVLAGCVQTVQTNGDQVQTLVIGYTRSESGTYASTSQKQVQGLQLWADNVNAQGGFRVGDQIYQIELRSYDDQSDKAKVQELYGKLIQEDRVDFLVSPYSSGLADAAAAVSEQHGKLMIVTGAAADSIFDKGYQYSFQVYTPASRYLAGAVDMLKATDPQAKRVAILYEQTQFASEVAAFAQEYAQQQGLEIVLFEGYTEGNTDFADLIPRLQEAQADALLGGGHQTDGIALAQALYDPWTEIHLVALLVAPAATEFASIGKAAYYITGPSQWEPQAQYNPEGAAALGLPFHGPSSAEFVRNYQNAYGSDPSYHAAGGYAAGLILQQALEEAASLEQLQVKNALEKMDMLTFYGRIKFDSRNQHGLQIGHEMSYLQWQGDTEGQLVKQIIWPEAGRSAPLLYPRQQP